MERVAGFEGGRWACAVLQEGTEPFNLPTRQTVSLCVPLLMTDQGLPWGSSELQNRRNAGAFTDSRILGGSWPKREGVVGSLQLARSWSLQLVASRLPAVLR